MVDFCSERYYCVGGGLLGGGKRIVGKKIWCLGGGYGKYSGVGFWGSKINFCGYFVGGE